MTDTDRLAALLHKLRIGCTPDPTTAYHAKCHAEEADRLAAAGVTLDPPEYGGALYAQRFTNSDHNSAPQPDTASRELREAAQAVVDESAHPDGPEYRTMRSLIDALRAALAATEGE